MRLVVVVVMVAMGHCARDAIAQVDDEERTLAAARNAFEYRDFPKVIELLDPWVHPPRIADPARLAEAQRLLGVSLHVRGDVEAARREFEQVLRYDPGLRLDPFAVPPQVIEAFEAVRKEMKPVLDKVIEDKGRTPPGERPPEVVTTVPMIVAYAPLGLGHFLVLDEPEWGAVWLGAQLLGIGANVTGYWLGEGLVKTDPRSGGSGIEDQDMAAHDRYEAIRIVGLAVFVSAWIASGIQGHVFLRAQNRTQAATPAAGPVGFSPAGFELRFDEAAPDM
jgi:hypothetical protein